MTFKNSYAALINAKGIYDLAIENIERELSNKVDFHFAVIYQPSDGFVILHEEGSHNAPLAACIAIVEVKGRLSFDDYIKKAI